MRIQKDLATFELSNPSQYRSQGADQDEGIDFDKLLFILRRNWVYLVLSVLFGIAVSVAYVANTTPIYSASVSISLDTVEAANVRELSGVENAPMTESQVTTELEILRSEAIATKVVDRYNLSRNGAFMAQPRSGLDHFIGAARAVSAAAIDFIRSQVTDVPPLPDIPEDAEETPGQTRAEAIGILQRNVSVQRLRDSRIVTISFRSLSPDMAAGVANAIAETYIDDQLESKYDSTERATNWLKERSDQLREQLAEIDNAVDQFRLANNLLGARGNSNLEDELERFSMQLVAAETELINLTAKQRQLQEIIQQGDRSAAVSATATQGITNELRGRFLDTLKEYNSLLQRLGPDHEQTLKLARELDQTQELMFEEIKRSERITENDIATVRERIVTLQAQKEEAERLYGAGSEVVLKLRELERNAETVRILYSGFFQRYQESLQEQSFAVSDVRIINQAKVPSGPTSPNSRRIVVIGAITGLLLAALWIGFREYRDNKVRTEADVQDVLGLEFLGACAVLNTRTFLAWKSRKSRKSEQGPIILPSILRYGVDNPLSTFSETLRSMKLAVSLKLGTGKEGSEGVVIGVLSSFSGEGKTTIAGNFASLVASQGKKVILVDADLRNPSLSRALAVSTSPGLLQIFSKEADWKSVIRPDKETGLDVIVAGKGRAFHTSELLASPAMGAFLRELRKDYDYVVLDVPPLGPVIDARACLDYMDSAIFVIEWGKTKLNEVQTIINRDSRLREKSAGAVLNFFDARRAAAYGSYASYYYYKSEYKRYYNGS